jgi:hypothetical protein
MPVAHYAVQPYGAMILPSGGGSPRLALVINYTYEDALGSIHGYPLRYSISLDFGQTFSSGKDVGPQNSSGSTIGTGTDVPLVDTFIALPGGQLYVNGKYSTPSTSLDWKAGRLCDDWRGLIWRNASTLSGDTIDNTAIGGAAKKFYSGSVWVTRGGNQGSLGSGGKTAGGYKLQTNAHSSRASVDAYGVVSSDGGNTWSSDTTQLASAIPGSFGPIISQQGAGVPSSGLGLDNQNYLNVSNWDVYHKSSGVWSFSANWTGSYDFHYHEPRRPPINHLRALSTDGASISRDDYRSDNWAFGSLVTDRNPNIMGSGGLGYLGLVSTLSGTYGYQTGFSYTVNGFTINSNFFGFGEQMLWAGDADNIYWIKHEGSGINKSILYSSKDDHLFIDHARYMEWSSTKDGSNLAFINIDANICTGFSCGSRLVVVACDGANTQLLQVYVSTNDGVWFSKACHTLDGGVTWIPD